MKKKHFKPCIYSITNKVNGKKYIGRASYPTQRKREHFNKLLSGTHTNTVLQRAYNKYGKDSFEFEIIELVESVDYLNEREIHWINYHNSMLAGYNLESGGRQGKKMSEETKQKMSKNNPKVWLGKKYGNHNHSIKTYQYDLDGKLVKEWESVSQIKDTLGYDPSMISKCCTGNQKTSYGFQWSHVLEVKSREVPHYNGWNEKPVHMICLNTGNILKTFATGMDAVRELGAKSNKICLVCSGKRRSFAGYGWKYA